MYNLAAMPAGLTNLRFHITANSKARSDLESLPGGPRAIRGVGRAAADSS